MREYPKIDNLFKRNPEKKSELLIGQYTRPEFALINEWDVTEKIDGTNVQLKFHRVFNGSFDYNGRTERAQFTIGQENFLEDLGQETRGYAVAIMNSFDLDSLTVYGELYGPKIQAGGNYSETLGFRAFDMLVNDRVWLAPEDVRKNAAYMNLEMAPHLGLYTVNDLFALVANGFKSTFSLNEDYDAEGVIAKPLFNLYDQRGSRVMFKLKTCDLKHVHN
ncbi:RNA ligase [Streptomyces phage Annadreamy]|uniref:RNA ligase n=1 Tax=Streptomyces phage Annadreamy TaxID=2250335 RepID=A0A345GTK6_9CAUD|nr:RNA ligase [Streptomyces phage Annadreamy]AXG66278.1 RNA ligase [Streptomyces phage Annadreamy]